MYAPKATEEHYGPDGKPVFDIPHPSFSNISFDVVKWAWDNWGDPLIPAGIMPTGVTPPVFVPEHWEHGMWTQTRVCPNPLFAPTGYANYALADAIVNDCLNNQAVTIRGSTFGSAASFDGLNFPGVSLWGKTGAVSVTRYQHLRSWELEVYDPQAYVEPNMPVLVPDTLVPGRITFAPDVFAPPLIVPGLPHTLPIQRPAPLPVPPPFRFTPKPGGNAPGSSYTPGRVIPLPGNQIPALVLEPKPGENGHTIKPGVHVLQPPPPGTKEVKRKITPALFNKLRAAAEPVLRGTGETVDLINAVHSALPEKYQCKGYCSPQRKALAIYKNADKVDSRSAAYNIIQDVANDAFLGRLGQGGREAGRRGNWLDTIGAGTGPAM